MTPAEASAARAAYRAIVGPWAEDRLARQRTLTKHPVRDFLFEYYNFKPSQLLRWSPGLGVTLEGVAAAATDWPADFVGTPAGATLDPTRFSPQRHRYLRWATDYLRAVGEREPFYGCFGLHEWAMVYDTPEVRHGRVPLRLGHAGTDAHVESTPLRCTHYDAYRFFAPTAVPRNRTPLTRESTETHDQPGCVHVTMDLYKFAFKLAPFCASSVVAAAFALACRARELDMRASPYDMSAYGLEPLAIETKDGREEYVRAQRELTATAAGVRARLLGESAKLAAAVASPGMPPAGACGS